jgi:general nucleoside transport system permease protein
VIDPALLVDFLGTSLRLSVPLVFAAVGGLLAERSGVYNIALEGMMLSGAFGAAVGAYLTGAALPGLGLGTLLGALGGLLLAVLGVSLKVNQIVAGIAINLLAVGLTRFFLNLAFDSSSNSPRVPGFGVSGRSGGMLGALTNPLVWLGLLAIPAVAFVVHRTPFGLRVRAAGEKPEAAESLGVRVAPVRYLAVAVSGLLSALGGAYLALDQHQFTDQMTAGRGFIALAAVIFGAWHPVGALGAALVFGFAGTTQTLLAILGVDVPPQLLNSVPYVVTIVVVAGVVGRVRGPAAAGQPYEQG